MDTLLQLEALVPGLRWEDQITDVGQVGYVGRTPDGRRGFAVSQRPIEDTTGPYWQTGYHDGTRSWSGPGTRAKTAAESLQKCLDLCRGLQARGEMETFPTEWFGGPDAAG